MKQEQNELSRATTAAGITQREVAKLLRVTILTAHRWLHGRPIQTRSLARHDAVIRILNECVVRQKLPLRYSGRGEDKVRREAAIHKLLTYIDERMRG